MSVFRWLFLHSPPKPLCSAQFSRLSGSAFTGPLYCHDHLPVTLLVQTVATNPTCYEVLRCLRRRSFVVLADWSTGMPLVVTVCLWQQQPLNAAAATVVSIYSSYGSHPRASPLCRVISSSSTLSNVYPIQNALAHCDLQLPVFFSLPRVQICMRYGQEILEAKMKRPAI